MEHQSGKRILMLLENNTYVEDVRVRQEAQVLLAAGFPVTVLCPSKLSFGLVDGVGVYGFPTPPSGNGVLGYVIEYGYSMLAVFVLTLVILFREGFDVIHAHNPPDTFALIGLFYKLLGKQFVFDQHDLSPELYAYARFSKSNSVIYKMLILFEGLSYKIADHVIVTNESYCRTSTQRSGVSETKVSIVRNGPDLSLPAFISPVEMEVKKDDTIQIAYMGVIGYQDGIECLIQGLHHLMQDFGKNDFHCTVMGKGIALDTARTLVQELGLSEHVTFTGWLKQAEIAEIMKTIDICVAPEPSNRYNDLSTVIKLMEYMAYAKPVVAFDLPEHRVTSQDTIVYARPNDTRDLAAQIATLIEDRELRRDLGLRGRKRIEDRLAWSFQAQVLIKVYQEL